MVVCISSSFSCFLFTFFIIIVILDVTMANGGAAEGALLAIGAGVVVELIVAVVAVVLLVVLVLVVLIMLLLFKLLTFLVALSVIWHPPWLAWAPQSCPPTIPGCWSWGGELHRWIARMLEGAEGVSTSEGRSGS